MLSTEIEEKNSLKRKGSRFHGVHAIGTHNIALQLTSLTIDLLHSFHKLQALSITILQYTQSWVGFVSVIQTCQHNFNLWNSSSFSDEYLYGGGSRTQFEIFPQRTRGSPSSPTSYGQRSERDLD